MHEVFKLIEATPTPKIAQNLHQFWKTLKFFKQPKPRSKCMKCMKNDR